MAITYKGNNYTLIGKHFIFNNEKVSYEGKIYKESYLFKSDSNKEYILDESDLYNLQEFSSTEELANNIESIDSLLQDLQDKYINATLPILQNLIMGKETDRTELNNIYKDMMNFIKENYHNNLELSGVQDSISLEAQKQYLTNLALNKSSISIESLFNSLNNFIYSNN